MFSLVCKRALNVRLIAEIIFIQTETLMHLVMHLTVLLS